MSPQYGELRPTSSWDRFVSLGQPCKFQRVSHLGSVIARHSSSGRQPNFAVLNRGRHLYSAERPSRWALAHISSYNDAYPSLLKFTCRVIHLFLCLSRNMTREHEFVNISANTVFLQNCPKLRGQSLWLHSQSKVYVNYCLFIDIWA